MNTRAIESGVLSPNCVKLGWQGMVYASVMFYVSCCPRFGLGAPFHRSRGGTRLQGVGARVGLDRGMARVNLRLPYWRGLDRSCCGVLGDDGRAFPRLTPYTSLGIGPYIRTPVCLCSRHVGSGLSPDFHCSTLLWKGACGLEGLAV
jgi:hypothetical protein